jgi:hypothetical protein
MAYTEPMKNRARSLVIENAIAALTVNRTTSTLARRSYVGEVKAHFTNGNHALDRIQAARLSDETIGRWESFYDAITQSRTPANLKIAYLSGPNPENDLRVFCSLGVLPENIWAFESENSIYSEAVVAALASEFPFIKLLNGGIDAFLEASLQRFDVIYLDFCGPLPSRNKKQKTLRVLTQVLGRHALYSPGIVITNFALPTVERDPTGRALLAKLVACYLYPKEFLEDKTSPSGFIEGPIAHSYDPEGWHKLVEGDMENYYSQFVTRLLMDHASFISPYDRFPKDNVIFRKFFNVTDDAFAAKAASLFHFDEDTGGGDTIVDPGMYPVLWTFAALDKHLNRRDPNYPQFVFTDQAFSDFADLFLTQLSFNGDKQELLGRLPLLSHMLSEQPDADEYLSDSIKQMKQNHHFSQFYQFCDLVLFHQIVELLFRQVANPYHVNVEKTRRWTYQAKQTPMFMDMTILDECRYLYDWMPTADMFSVGISDIERQLSYRFVLDGVAKHRRWYNTEYFFGTAVVDQDTEPFEAKTLRPREAIVQA